MKGVDGYMKFTDDVLKKIMGKRVRITCVDMKSYIGIVDDYIYPDDNHNGKAGLIIETADKRLVEFCEDETLEIELYDPETEDMISSIMKVRFKMWENGPGTIEDMKTFVYEIYPDGKVSRYIYQGKNRTCVDKETLHISENRKHRLFAELVKALMLDERDILICEVCDGCSYTLQITYMDGQKKVIDGDVGGGTYDKLLTDFLDSIFE